jgi:NTE family protein
VKGYAHVGVLRVLESHGYRVRAIAGTSAGGMVGAAYAAGVSVDELESCLMAMDQSKLFLRQPGDAPAMMGLAGVIPILQGMLSEKTFQETRFPLAVTAVNLDTAELVALQRGRLLDAVLATIAVPGIFPHRIWEGQRLIDGGVLDPVPVALARFLDAGAPVVAVVLSPPRAEWVRPTPPRLLASLPFLSDYLTRHRIAQALNIFLRSIDLAGAELTELRLQIDRPEVVIRPDVPHIGFLDSVPVTDVIRLGEQAAERALPDLERALSWQGRLARRAASHEFNGKVYSWKNGC